MMLLALSCLLAEPANSPPTVQSRPSSQPAVVAVAGQVQRPGTYRVPAMATIADLLSVAAGSPKTPAGVTLVRNEQMHTAVPTSLPLQYGDAVLVDPVLSQTVRHLVVLSPQRVPLVVGVPAAEANVASVCQLFSLTDAASLLRVAPGLQPDGSLADGVALLLPPGRESDATFESLATQCPLHDAVAVLTAQRAASSLAATSTTAPQNTMADAGRPIVRPRSMPTARPNQPAAATADERAMASGPATAPRTTPDALLPVQSASLSTSSSAASAASAASAIATPLPASGEPGHTSGALHAGLPHDALQPNSAMPPRGLAPFPARIDVSVPTLTPGVVPEARAADMLPVDAPTALKPSPTPSLARLAQTARLSPRATNVDPTVLQDGGSSRVTTDRQIVQTAGEAVPQPLTVGEATPLAEATTPLADLAPTASRLGGVMFAAIVLVVVCGGLVMVSRGRPATTPVAAAPSEELPVTVAPIEERPATTVPPTALHGEVVGLDRMRLDSAHAIAPPHYARGARHSRPAPATATQGAATQGAATQGGTPVSGPRFAQRQAARAAVAQSVGAQSLGTQSAGAGAPGRFAQADPPSAAASPRPADLLARAIQAMEREQRSS